MYIQLNEAGEYLQTIPPKINFEWDASHFQPPETLSEDEAEYFQVSPLVDTPMPTYDPATEAVDEIDPAEIAGSWTQQWLVRPATQGEMDAYEDQQALLAKEQADQQAADEAKADQTIQWLMTHTAAEITAKVQTDITNLETAKTYIAKLGIAVGALGRNAEM